MHTIQRYPKLGLDRCRKEGTKTDETCWEVSSTTEEASYRIQISYDGTGEEMRWFVSQNGERYEFLPDEAFDQNVRAFIQHEIKDKRTGQPATQEAMMTEGEEHFVEFTEDEAAGILHDGHNRWPWKAGTVFGFRMNILSELEKHWRVVNYIANLSYCD